MIFQVLNSTDNMCALARHMVQTLSFLFDDFFESIASVLRVDEDLIVGLELLANWLILSGSIVDNFNDAGVV